MLPQVEADAWRNMGGQVYGAEWADDGYQRGGEHGNAEATDGVQVALQNAFINDAGR